MLYKLKTKYLYSKYVGRKGISEETIDAVIAFSEKPDISYCCPGRQDTVYCGKEEEGKKVYKSKQFLLWAIREIVALHNNGRRYSELKYVKMNLKENEAILSVDFSKNYENKQRNEIQSAYFGHEAFTIFTAACYFKDVQDTHDLRIDEDTNLYILPIVVISNQTNYERNIVFACNKKVIDTIKRYLPQLNRVYFWSDGCASQFRSHFVFRSLSYYPKNIMLLLGLW